MQGRRHPSTSGSGQHQKQHGNNIALLPSNCYHSPSVLLLRYCSADQPLRAVYGGLLPDTHMHITEHMRTHTCVNSHVYMHRLIPLEIILAVWLNITYCVFI